MIKKHARKNSPDVIKRATEKYTEKMKSLGFIHSKFWVKPEEKEKVRAFLDDLRRNDGIAA